MELDAVWGILAELADEARMSASAATKSDSVPLAAAVGRVSAELVRAPEPLPRFVHAAMDGYAVRSVDTADATPARPVHLPVTPDYVLAAGDTPRPMAGMACMRIATGAPMPLAGYDTCVRTEDAVLVALADPAPCGATEALVVTRPLPPYKDCRRIADDVDRGEPVLWPGDMITPAGVLLLCALGIDRVAVVPRIRIGLVTTGKEVAAPTTTTDGKAVLGQAQVRNCNAAYVHAVYARNPTVQVAFVAHCVDDDGTDFVACALARAEAERSRRTDSDAAMSVTVSIGGVSKGPFDHVAASLCRAGYTIVLHGVRMRPGHPVLVARHPATPASLWFGLPGNPGAVASTLRFLVDFYVDRLCGRPLELPTKVQQQPKLSTTMMPSTTHTGLLHGTVVAEACTEDGCATTSTTTSTTTTASVASAKQKSGMLTDLARATCWINASDNYVWPLLRSGGDAYGGPVRTVRAVVLCGGRSLRMGGAPKALREIAHGGAQPPVSALTALADVLAPLCTLPVYVSVRKEQLPQNDMQWAAHGLPALAAPLVDAAYSAAVGPAAGLLAAHVCDPYATWVVVACDMLGVTTATLVQLLAGHPQDGVTWFAGEPLLSVWSPLALAALAANVARGRTGPIQTITDLGDSRVRTLVPRDPRWLLTANTAAEWDAAALELARNNKSDRQ